MIRLVKRYGSRKLYDTEESRYVSLDEIREWVRAGQQVRVLDTTSDEDVTVQTLTQVILEGGRKGTSFVSSDVLHQLIRRGGELLTTGVEQISNGVDRALQASLDRLPPLKQVREETAILRRRLEALEASLADLEREGREEGANAAQATRQAATPVPGEPPTTQKGVGP